MVLRLFKIILFVFIFILSCVIHYQLCNQNNEIKNSYYNIKYKMKDFKNEIDNTRLTLYNFGKKVQEIHKIAENIDSQMFKSTVLIPTQYEILKLDNNFDKNKIIELNLTKDAKQMPNGAYYANAQILWCSQFESGYLSMGLSLPSFKVDKSNEWNWNKLDQIQNNNSNQQTLFTNQNQTDCENQESKVKISDDGVIQIESQGQSSKNYEESKQAVTELSFVIKGQYVRYNSIESITKQIDKNTKNIKKLLDLGRIQLNIGNYEEAKKQQEKVILIDPNIVEAYFQIGQALIEAKMQDDANLMFNKGIDINPANFHAYQDIGKVYFKKEKWDEAIKWFKNLVKLNARDALTLEHLGVCYTKKGNQKEAIRWIKLALINDSENILLIKQLGLVLYLDGKQDEAIRSYREAIKLDSNDAKSQEDIGQCYQQSKRQTEAINWFKKALKINPNDEVSLYIGLSLIYNGDKQKCIEWIDGLILKNPKNQKFIQNVGQIFFENELLDEAIIQFEKTIEINSFFSKAQENLALIQSEKKIYNKEIDQLKKVIELDPKNFEAIQNVGLAYKNIQNQDEAIKQFEKAIEINNELIFAQENLSDIQFSKDNFIDSIKQCEKIIEIDPKNVEAYLNIGSGYRMMKKQDKAIQNFLKVIEIDPYQVQAQEFLVSVQQDQGNNYEQSNWLHKARKAKKWKEQYDSQDSGLM